MKSKSLLSRAYLIFILLGLFSISFGTAIAQDQDCVVKKDHYKGNKESGFSTEITSVSNIR